MSISEATALKFGAVFEIIIAALIGSGLPFLYLHLNKSENHFAHDAGLDTQPVFFLLKAISCGIIIGVALLHLLPDADELLAEHFDYPVCFAAAGLGVVLCLVCEQFAMWIVSTTDSDENAQDDDYDTKRPLLQGEDLIGSLVKAVDKENKKQSKGRSHDHDGHGHDNSHGHDSSHGHDNCQSHGR